MAVTGLLSLLGTCHAKSSRPILFSRQQPVSTKQQVERAVNHVLTGNFLKSRLRLYTQCHFLSHCDSLAIFNDGSYIMQIQALVQTLASKHHMVVALSNTTNL